MRSYNMFRQLSPRFLGGPRLLLAHFVGRPGFPSFWKTMFAACPTRKKSG